MVGERISRTQSGTTRIGASSGSSANRSRRHPARSGEISGVPGSSIPGSARICPGCGVPMVEDDGVQCPRCGEHLDELVHALVERHPHRVRLLVVEERFESAGRGLLLMPGAPITDATRGGVRLELRRPDRTTAWVQAHVELTFSVPPAKERWATVRLEGVTKADVPVGTEVWRVR